LDSNILVILQEVSKMFNLAEYKRHQKSPALLSTGLLNQEFPVIQFLRRVSIKGFFFLNRESGRGAIRSPIMGARVR